MQVRKGHAWERTGTNVLVGGGQMDAFKVIATFTEPRLFREADCALPR